jgi:YidC/Oxa1 family membrane protein insertase
MAGQTTGDSFKMKLDKVQIAVIAGGILFILLWQFMVPKSAPVPAVPTPPAAAAPAKPGAGTTQATPEAPSAPVAVSNTKEELALLETRRALPLIAFPISPLAEASIDPVQGGLRNIALKAYDEAARSRKAVSRPVTMLPKPETVFASVVSPARPVNETQAAASQALTAIRVVRQDGLAIRETWTPSASGGYTFSYTVTAENTGDLPYELKDLEIALGAVPSPTSTGMFSSNADSADIDALPEGKNKLRTFNYKAGKPVASQADEQYRWVAIHSKYFICYLESNGAPMAGFTGRETLFGSEKWTEARVRLQAVTLAPKEKKEWVFRGYVGPKEYSQMAALGTKTVGVLRMSMFFFFYPDWMGWISCQVLKSLLYLGGLFHCAWGYGLAIIAITLIIKMAFWPLTHHGTVSMHKMQQIQPKVKELQEKHKNDPKTLNEKTMALYKEHNVNPVSGCLPILLQMPVFFALFNTFRAAIELRHAEFLWVNDLAMPDTVFILPLGFADLPIRPLAILMGVTMVWQQLMMPKAGDPMQARMMQIMTAFFVILLYGMPAGLTLYWTVNQTLSIVQSYFTNRKLKRMQAQA